ncbi:STAS domain-containing protein [Streptomyces bambusae]|uniref:STAS domain-containing protein n=1 Tax=Streptomyces bambusae TaxID=1550616 RepID=A0ABS6Z8Y4_9ACTN|nr:STAS domain-containing protein [Streptomyces bambusae]MBW5484228.1 STAS domain-containing protein [Streptomyces bambusae]
MSRTMIALRTVTRDDLGPGVAVVGELDIHTAAAVEPSLTRLADGGGHLVLDLSGLSFCDSAGIELFLRLHRRCVRAGARLLLDRVPLLLVKSIRVLGADRELSWRSA